MSIKSHLLQGLALAIIPAAFWLSNHANAQTIQPQREITSPSDIIRPDIQPLPSIDSIQDLPKAPDDTDPIGRLIERLSTGEPGTEPKAKPSDQSGQSIRDEIGKKYDQEFQAGFEDDGWENVSAEKFTCKPSGRILMDYVNWLDDSEIGGASDYFEFRQARLTLAGTGYGVYEYKFDMEFEPEVADTSGGSVVSTFGSVAMRDLFIGIKDMPLFGNVRVGNQKVHFSLSTMLARQDMTFAERPPMSDPPGFSPLRKVGVSSMSHSADLNKTLGYGIYFADINDLAKERQDDNQGMLFGTRSTWLPFYDEPSDGRYLVHVGSGFIYSTPPDNALRFRGRPSIHEAPFMIDSGPLASNRYSVWGGELAIQRGAFLLESELMYSRVDEVAGGKRDLWGCYVEGSYRLTGEHRSYIREQGVFGRLTPYENCWLVPGSNGIGAWEIAARYSYTDFHDSPNNADLKNIDLGLIWYWTPDLRLDLNYIHPMTDGGTFGNTQSDALLMRMSVYF